MFRGGLVRFRSTRHLRLSLNSDEPITDVLMERERECVCTRVCVIEWRWRMYTRKKSCKLISSLHHLFLTLTPTPTLSTAFFFLKSSGLYEAKEMASVCAQMLIICWLHIARGKNHSSCTLIFSSIKWNGCGKGYSFYTLNLALFI